MELSIDTSTRYAAVGLSAQGGAVAELAWRSERNHSVELAPTVRELMARSRVEMRELEAIFIARGPGGFSALRVGMSFAKAVASALGVPLVAVGTLDVEAAPYLGLGSPVCAVIEAGRDRVYLGYYWGPEAGGPRYEVTNLEGLVSGGRSGVLFCGEGAQAVAPLLRGRLGPAARVADVPPPTRRASVLALLGYTRWQAGATDDPAAVQPLYLRSSQVEVAQRTWAP